MQIHNKLKIAFVGLRGVPANYSGIEVAVEEIAARLVARGHEVTVYCMARNKLLKPNDYRGIRLRYIPCIQSKNAEMITYAFLATCLSALGAYDIVHFQALGPATFALVPRLLGKRTVVTVHGLDWQRAKWGRLAQMYLRCGEWAAAKFPHETVVVSKSLRQYFSTKYGTKVEYIPNSIPDNRDRAQTPNDFRLIPSQLPYIVFVGRLVPEKGISLLLDAFKDLETEARLVIIGGGATEYEQALKSKAKSDQRIVFTGALYGDSVREFLKRAILYVLPSDVEGLPISLIEAMSVGAPVLVSDIPENLEVLEHEGSSVGYTFQRNNVSSLRDALSRILATPREAKSNGVLGIQVVKAKYNWDAITDALELVYRRGNVLEGELASKFLPGSSLYAEDRAVAQTSSLT